jgi:hypothetical protein
VCTLDLSNSIGEQAARWAGRLGGGWWGLGDAIEAEEQALIRKARDKKTQQALTCPQ